MSSVTLQKKIGEFIPIEVGILLSHLPFKLRLGRDYKLYQQLIEKLLYADTEHRRSYIIESFKNIVSHFKNYNDFYAHHLRSSGSATENITDLGDIARLPLLAKSQLKAVPLTERSNKKLALKEFNTGGTTGVPLSFFVENNFYSREWSHMHFIWKRIGYDPSRTKVTIRGRSLKNICEYNFNQNEFLINAYHTYDSRDYSTLLKIFKKYNTEFIHGYPSSIYGFLKDASVKAPYLIDFFKKNIRGIMFGSEYPSPQYRTFIEDLLTDNSISWYGHTEGVILACELNQKYEYVPFLSYGYAEAVKIDNFYHLVGTSFSNLASPFIRYDTEDLIDPDIDEIGFLRSFRITEGRIGEFVIDKNGNHISLTALIFGRHHKLFNVVDFIQVQQNNPGSITVIYSSTSFIEDARELFDTSNLHLDIHFKQVKEPYRTALGKIPLLIRKPYEATDSEL
jgi:phenylacetate-CoA ligase